MKNRHLKKLLACGLGALALTACSDKEPAAPVSVAQKPAIVMPSKPANKSNYAPANPFLADSVLPIGHINSAQSTGVNVAGPTGPSEVLTQENGGLTYTHIGPGHFGSAISAPYPNGKRVIWSNGQERISKLDYDTLEVLAEYELTDAPLHKLHGAMFTEEEADELFDSLDSLPMFRYSGMLTVLKTIPTAKKYYGAGLAGVYYMLSSDNELYVAGKDAIFVYGDTDPTDPTSPITLKREWKKPAAVTGSFNSMNMTHDGMVFSVTDDGWVVLVERDFSNHHTLLLTGGEVAPKWNQLMLDMGISQGQATWVRNGAAIDQAGNIFLPSLEHLHKVSWDGKELKNVWAERYSNKGHITVSFEDVINPETGQAFSFENANYGSGATASFMGFGEEDKFVVITDGDEAMNVTLFWRDEIPEGWQKLPHAPSRRIAGMTKADFGNPNIESVQTEQSVVVGGYGAMVVNNAPANKPIKKAPDAAYIGLAGHHPDYTPHGIQKFEWDPEAKQLKSAWVNNEVSSANCVPIVSNGSDTVYTLGGRNGKWTMFGANWTTGETALTYEVGSSRYNTQFAGILMDEEGRLLHNTIHGIVRYERPGKN